MKRKVLLWVGLWLSFLCGNVFSASSNDDEIGDFLDDQVNILNVILDGGNSLELHDGQDDSNIDQSRLPKQKPSKNSKHKKNKQQSGEWSVKTKQNSNGKDETQDKEQKEIDKHHELISAYEMQKSSVVLENGQENLKPFGLGQRKKHPENSTSQLYKEDFEGKKPVFLDQGLSNDLNVFNDYGETDGLTFSKNPFLVDNRRGNFQLAYNEGIISNSKQLKLLAYNLFGEETLEDLLLTKYEIKSFINQADNWIKEVIFDDSNWRLEDAIYGSTAFMFIYDSSVIRFLRKLDGGSESLEQIKEKYNIENGTADASEKLYAEDSALARGYYSILEFWKAHSRTMIYLLLSFIIIKELAALITRAVNSRNKKKSRRKKSKISRKNMRTRQLDRASSTPAYAGAAIDGEIKTDKTKVMGRKHSSHRHYSSRRRRPKRSFIRKMLDDIFVKSTHKK